MAIKSSELKKVIAYTDGACSGNPGPGGYGVVLRYSPHERELSEGFRLTTNSRMEIWAAIAALKALKAKCTVRIYSDSKYLVDGVSQGGCIDGKQIVGNRRKRKLLIPTYGSNY